MQNFSLTLFRKMDQHFGRLEHARAHSKHVRNTVVPRTWHPTATPKVKSIEKSRSDGQKKAITITSVAATTRPISTDPNVVLLQSSVERLETACQLATDTAEKALENVDLLNELVATFASAKPDTSQMEPVFTSLRYLSDATTRTDAKVHLMEQNLEKFVTQSTKDVKHVTQLNMELLSNMDKMLNRVTFHPTRTHPSEPVASSSSCPTEKNSGSSEVARKMSAMDAKMLDLQDLVLKGKDSITELDNIVSKQIQAISTAESRLVALQGQYNTLTTAYTSVCKKLESYQDRIAELEATCQRLDSQLRTESMMIESLQTDVTLIKLDNVSAETVIKRPTVIDADEKTPLGSFRFVAEDDDKNVCLNIQFMNAEGEWETITSGIATVAMNKLLKSVVTTPPATAAEAVTSNQEIALENVDAGAAATDLINSLRDAATQVAQEPPATSADQCTPPIFDDQEYSQSLDKTQ